MENESPAQELANLRAKELLQNPKLFELITEQEFDKKIVGEMENRKSIFLVCCGIFVKNHNTASFNICINSNSGAGKDYIANNITKILPPEMLESRTRISAAAFTYWHNNHFEPDWSWNGKVCYLQDISNTILNSDVFKVMCSEGSFATVVKDQRAIDILISGKPCMIITTASAQPTAEILRRFPILMLNETVNQTKSIMWRQAEYAAKGIPTEYSEEVMVALKQLQTVKVRIPFAEKIVKAYPADHIIMRTHFSRLLDYIRASAALYQFQRERDEEGYVIAVPEDYDRAAIAIRQTTKNALMIPLTRKQEQLLNLCKKVQQECGRLDGWFPLKDVVKKCNFLAESKVYSNIDDLGENFFDMNSEEPKDDDGKTRGRPYKILRLKLADFVIPDWKDLEKEAQNTSSPFSPLPKPPNSTAKIREEGREEEREGRERIKGESNIEHNLTNKDTKQSEIYNSVMSIDFMRHWIIDSLISNKLSWETLEQSWVAKVQQERNRPVGEIQPLLNRLSEVFEQLKNTGEICPQGELWVATPKPM